MTYMCMLFKSHFNFKAHFALLCIQCYASFKCIDAVGWVTEMASSLQQILPQQFP